MSQQDHRSSQHKTGNCAGGEAGAPSNVADAVVSLGTEPLVTVQLGTGQLNTGRDPDLVDDELCPEEDALVEGVDFEEKEPVDDAQQSAVTSVNGVRAYRWHRQPAHLLSWWEQLPEQTQAALAGLRPGDALDPAAAAALAEVGFATAQVWMPGARGQRVRRNIASAGLISQLQLLRMSHSERRLV